MASHNSLHISVFAILCIGLGSALYVEIRPNLVGDTMLTPVKISCLLDPEVDNDSDEMMVLELKKNGKVLITLRHKSDVKFAAGVEAKFQVNGRIDKINSQSFLKTSLMTPTPDDAGTYECLMYFLDFQGDLTEKTAHGNLTYDVTDEVQQTLTDKVSALEIQMDSLQRSLDVQAAKEKARPVFSAKSTKVATLRVGGTIVFDHIMASEGHGYDANTGVFTAPTAGIYNFELSAAMGKTNGFINVDIVVNNIVEAGITAADKDFDDQSSISFLVKLAKGCEVKAVLRARSNPRMTLNTGNGFTMFSGYLIKE